MFPSLVHGFYIIFTSFHALPKRNFIFNSFTCIALLLFQKALIINDNLIFIDSFVDKNHNLC